MSYAEAKIKYAAMGIDTDAAMAKLKTVPVSLHCWQGDDVRGFDTDPSKPLTGGIQTTGNYPGRARTPEELMADLDKVLTLIPGRPKMNLHASYAIFEEGEWVDRDKLEPKHFAKWVEFCKAHNCGCDFNPTFFSHPMCDPLTLSSTNEETRKFWIEHGKACIRWDSDHVVLFDDETKEIAKEIVRCGGLDGKVNIALDYFDASINRISAWAVGYRNLQKALLFALLCNHEALQKLQDEGNFTELMVRQEEMKTLPFGEIWDEYCRMCNAPVDGEWYDEVKKYEAEVLAKRG